VHDTVDLEGRGVPSVFVATVEFTDGAEHQARIQDRTDPEMRAIADQAFETLLAQLVSGDSAGV
jgi:hypothetical protein